MKLLSSIHIKIMFIFLSFYAATCLPMQAQERLNSNTFSIMAGISQPLALGGANLAVTYTTDKFYFEYSHGAFLKYHNSNGVAMTDEEKMQFETLNVPFSTGGGVGYRFSTNGQLFWELKLHKFEFGGANSPQLEYKTFEMGPALSYRFFVNRRKSIFFEPVVRYWFTAAVLGNGDFEGKFVQVNKDDGSSFSHRAHEHGLFFNISFGFVLK